MTHLDPVDQVLLAIEEQVHAHPKRYLKEVSVHLPVGEAEARAWAVVLEARLADRGLDGVYVRVAPGAPAVADAVFEEWFAD